jgi:hypothetical protein
MAALDYASPPFGLEFEIHAHETTHQRRSPDSQHLALRRQAAPGYFVTGLCGANGRFYGHDHGDQHAGQETGRREKFGTHCGGPGSDYDWSTLPARTAMDSAQHHEIGRFSEDLSFVRRSSGIR